MKRLSAALFLLCLFPFLRAAEPTIRSVDFRFTPARPPYLSEDQMRAVAGIEAGSAISQLRVQDAIRNLFALGVFRQVEVKRHDEGGSVDLLFELDPFPQIDDIVFLGNRSIKRKDLVKEFPCHPADPADPVKVAQLTDRVLKLYESRGFFQAQCRLEEQPGRAGVRLELRIEEGLRARISQSVLAGEPGSPLPPPSVRKAAAMLRRPYDREEIEKRRQAIQEDFRQAGYFTAHVSVEVRKRPDPGAVALSFQVVTGPKVTLRVDGVDAPGKSFPESLALYRQADLSPFAEELSRDDLKRLLVQKGWEVEKVDSARTESPDGREVHIVFRVTAHGVYRKVSLVFHGLHAFSRKDLLEAVNLTESQALPSLPPDDVAQGIRNHYIKNGFLEAACQAKAGTSGADGRKPSAGDYTLELNVQENALFRVGAVRVDTDRPVDLTPLHASLAKWAGKPCTEAARNEIKTEITDYLGSRGWEVSDLAQRQELSGGIANITCEATIAGPGTLQNVVLFGDLKTRPQTLSRLLALHGGTPLDPGALHRAEGNLLSSGLMEETSMSVLPVFGTPGASNVLFRLREAPRFTFHYGFGYQEWEGPRGMVQLEHSNFLGRAQTVGLLVRGSRKKALLQLSFHDEHLLLNRYPLDISAYFDRQDKESYNSQRVSVSAKTYRRLGQYSSLAFLVAFQKIRNFDVVQDTGDLPRDEVPVTLTTFTSTWLRDTRDNYLDPARGNMTTVEFTAAPRLVGTDTGYLKYFFQEAYYRTLVSPVILAASFRYGAIGKLNTGDVPISERFFAGGSTTLRGFAQDEAGPLSQSTGDPLGGNALLIGNFELRFPIWSILDGAAFYDTGNVFVSPTRMSLKDFSHTLGLGFRIRTPIGPIRLDLSYNVKEMPGIGRFHYFITFGNPF